jgi:hypothetical protein
VKISWDLIGLCFALVLFLKELLVYTEKRYRLWGVVGGNIKKLCGLKFFQFTIGKTSSIPV